MPLYEFKCSKCGHKMETIQTFEAEAPLCPHCHIPMKRGCGSLAFFRFKGDIQGETPGSRKYGAEITRKTRR